MPAVSSPAPSDLIYVARQPILDARNRVFGYELLYRAQAGHSGCHAPGEVATARVLNDALLNVGLKALTLGKVAFFNVSPSVLLGDGASLLPPDGIVVELLEDMVVTDEVIQVCQSLQERGYALALDDFIPGSDAEILMPYVKYVKVDVLALSEEEMIATATRLLPKGIKLLAEKVETAAVRDAALKAGYTLFQGYYFCRPETISAKAFETSQLTQMKLLAALNNPSATLADIEDLIKRDGTLSIRVLRCVNSAGMGTRSEVRSIREALVLLGLEQIRKWASIWSLASLNTGVSEVLTTAVIRAKACEQLGVATGCPDGGSGYFLLGLCSLLEAILSRPMESALEVLPIDGDVRDALLGRPNDARSILEAVMHYEKAEWPEAMACIGAVGLSGDALDQAYGAARAWADDLTGASAA